MSKSIRSFDRMIIPAPCNADWDSMIGNDRVRFCEHCNLHVTNLSSLTRPEAIRLVARSEGRLCVRFMKRSDGSVVTKEVAERVHHIARRVSRIAAGAFTATLSLSSAAAQTPSTNSKPDEIVSNRPLQEKQRDTAVVANLRGTVLDPNGAVIPGVLVEILDTSTGFTAKTTSSDEGLYVFKGISPGTYNLKLSSVAGFANHEVQQLQVQSGADITQDVTLQLAQFTGLGGAVVIARPEDPFIRAAFENDLNAVVELLPTISDINASDQTTDTTALAYAVENNNLDMVHVLISAGAMPNGANSNGETPLMHLSSDASVEFLRGLVSIGADVKANDNSGRTPLMHAASHCPFALVNELIDAGARIDARDNEGNTVLMAAAENEDENVVQLLIKQRVPLDYKNNDCQSALMVAINAALGKNLKALIDAGATMSLTKEQLNNALIVATRAGDLITTKIVLKGGADANAKDDDTTALMLAAENGNPEMLKLLIDAGADLDALDDRGWTAMMHANEAENVRVLVNAGASVAIKNHDGETALGMAIRYDQPEIVQLLKSRGAPR
jgi:ankyrin repeat protein